MVGVAAAPFCITPPARTAMNGTIRGLGVCFAVILLLALTLKTPN